PREEMLYSPAFICGLAIPRPRRDAEHLERRIAVEPSAERPQVLISGSAFDGGGGHESFRVGNAEGISATSSSVVSAWLSRRGLAKYRSITSRRAAASAVADSR